MFGSLPCTFVCVAPRVPVVPFVRTRFFRGVGKPLGVVHRDVSPQNILVTYDGSVKIVDFGIAKAASKVSETRAGVLKGKYSYMSPEQATGDPLDHRTDIFALGIILYETTTGTRLFKRQNELATLQAIMRCDFKCS